MIQSLSLEFYIVKTLINKSKLPNPFNSVTSLQHTFGNTQFITRWVYDIPGKEIATLINEEKPAGNYTVEFNAGNLSSGIYFYRLQTSNLVCIKKMILLR